MARNTTALAVASNEKTAVLERVVVQGDLSQLQPAERVAYYKTVCDSLGLNPFTKPFEYINLNGKLTLYAKRDATDQLRSINGVSVEITSREMHDNGIYVVTARAKDRNGRTDEAIGAVSIAGLKGDALANAIMKCETKAKRRVTLSICGLGWLDETEVATVPDATAVDVDMETGEIKSPMKNVTPPKIETPAPTTNGAANATPNRDDLNAMALAYLHKAHRMSPQDYADFIDFRLGAKPDKVDIAKLKPLADYCNAAAQGNENAKAGVKKAVQEWRDAKRATGEALGEMQPDPVPGYEQEALV